jgi:hypothetical protein
MYVRLTTAGWVQDLGKKQKVRQTHLTNMLAVRAMRLLKKLLKVADMFQKQPITIITNHASGSRM